MLVACCWAVRGGGEGESGVGAWMGRWGGVGWHDDGREEEWNSCACKVEEEDLGF